MAGRTPSQTVGPFFHEALRWPDGGKVAFAENGRSVILTGRILDGAGDPVADALLETWQRSPEGRAPIGARGTAKPHAMGRLGPGEGGPFRLQARRPRGRGPRH